MWQTHAELEKKNEKPVCVKPNQLSLCNSTQNAEDYNESPSDESRAALGLGKSVNASETEFLAVPLMTLAHVQTEADKEPCSFYIFDCIFYNI